MGTVDLERQCEVAREVHDWGVESDLCPLVSILVWLIYDMMIGVLGVRSGDDGGLPFLVLNRWVDEDLDLRLPLVVVVSIWLVILVRDGDGELDIRWV